MAKLSNHIFMKQYFSIYIHATIINHFMECQVVLSSYKHYLCDSVMEYQLTKLSRDTNGMLVLETSDNRVLHRFISLVCVCVCVCARVCFFV